MGRDFRVFWGAYSVSELGSAVGMGALPLVAIVVLHASPAEVTGLAAVAGVSAALVTLPLGPWMEYQRKRPVMIGADVVRYVALASVPAAAAAGALLMPQLYVVAAVQVAATIVFGAASGAHLKGLVRPEDRVSSSPQRHSCWCAPECSTRPSPLCAYTWSTITTCLVSSGSGRPATSSPSRPSSRPREHWQASSASGPLSGC